MKIYAIYSIHMGNRNYCKYYLNPIKAQQELNRLQDSSMKGKKLSIMYGLEEIEVIE